MAEIPIGRCGSPVSAMENSMENSVAQPGVWLMLRLNRHGKEHTGMPTQRQFALVLLTVLTTAGLAVQAQSDKTSAMTSTAIEWNTLEVKTNATGSSRKFFEGPTANLEVLECHASTLNPGATNHVILRRPNDEVIIVKEGTIEAFVNDKWVRVGPGSVIFNAANSLQSMRNVGDGPATYHVIMFRPPATPQKPAAEKQN
jgi:mannose-6-phosphate isomerase-like protein (cupin superfamily)